MPARKRKPDAQIWLPNPPKGTLITVGFDGSENNDWTAIRCETNKGRSFTPRYGPDRRPTYWNPAEWGGEIPRREVHVAVEELFRKWRVRRMYCDPQFWATDIGEWSQTHGDEVVVEWATNRHVQMHAALERFRVDLKNGRIKHDGCPDTGRHMRHAHKVAANGDRYLLGKPPGDDHRKIDLTMSTVLAHEAAADVAAASAWEPESAGISYAMYGFN